MERFRRGSARTRGCTFSILLLPICDTGAGPAVYRDGINCSSALQSWYGAITLGKHWLDYIWVEQTFTVLGFPLHGGYLVWDTYLTYLF